MTSESKLRRTLVLTDNPRIADAIERIITVNDLEGTIKVAKSPNSHSALLARFELPVVSVKNDLDSILKRYELVISAHCKQIFPEGLHDAVECINIHPGLNPETRGWFPQVWAILKELPLGFTVHRIDRRLDHGDIIFRRELPLYAWDTSGSAYARVLDAEIGWLGENLLQILRGNYDAFPMSGDGNMFRKRDFDEILRLDLNRFGQFRDFLSLLRSTTFPGYKNAWFLDELSGKRIYVTVALEPEE
ncbi:MAG: hypothetical protein H7A19_14500 [Rhodanobacteraceae bacterium]|nr:hypothetical protein [Rhodanobacteraceae bacterium]